MTSLQALDDPRRQPISAVDEASLRWLLEEASAVAFGVAADAVRAQSRHGALVALARQSAMYLAHIVLGLNYSDVGRLFQRDRTTAAHACRRVEDRRDDPALDQRLDLLERVCSDAIYGLPTARPARQ
jgi:chromosomal replication initiation ATPase DnaA